MIRLLLVDDEPAAIRMIKKLLSSLEDRFGEILVAENGIEAMGYIDTDAPPDLIITDMDMPALNGISLLQYLADHHPDIYVIVVSGYYDYKYTHAAIRAKVMDYLIKPLDQQAFLSTVSKALMQIDSASNNIAITEDTQIRIDQETYMNLQKRARELKANLQKGERDNINSQLRSDFDYIQHAVADPKRYELVYKLYVNALTDFYTEHEYPVPHFPEYDELPHTPEGLLMELKNLFNACLEYIDKQRNHSSSKENLERINRYIYNHYRENLTLADLAALFFIKKEYLSTLFRKYYGETVGQLIIRLKIADSKRQLSYSDRTISEISESLGYLDPSHFNHQFKKETGIPPGQYRSRFSRSGSCSDG